jgi:hypothetical protein
MIYEALSAHLAANTTEFVFGETLFIHQAPFDQEFLGIFRDNPGGIEIDGYTHERAGSFQFVVRGKKQSVINAAMKSAMEALTINSLITADYNVKICRPSMEPLSYQLSVGNLKEISVNFSINYGIVQ